MNCAHCGAADQSGQVCVNCGNKLEATVNDVGSGPAVVRAIKGFDWQSALRLYVSALKKPIATSEQSDRGQFMIGVIVLAIFAIIVPLMSYFRLLSLPFFDVSFISVVIMPTFYLLLIQAIVVATTFLYLKLSGSSANFQDITVRYAVLMMLPLTLQLIALIASILRLNLITLATSSIGMFGMIAAICVVILGHRGELKEGRDAFHGILASLLVILLATSLIGRSIIANFMGSLF